MNYLCKHRGVLAGVSKRVDVPGDTGATAQPKRLIKEPQAQCHLIDDAAVVGGGLITHTPAAVHELQAACRQTTGSAPSEHGINPVQVQVFTD